MYKYSRIYIYYFRYPFDTQKCPIKVKVPEKFYNQFNMIWGDSPSIKEIKSTQYNVHQYLEYDGTAYPKHNSYEVILCVMINFVSNHPQKS